MESNKELKDEREMQEYYRKTINEIADKIKNVKYLKRICKLAEYLYIYKEE